ncbi:hypothetical protein LTS18_013756 [Coniosporium uncinatum]|uniref:Uncharacterized protein n=1 Tax=Coniosporium uncinatum TaxID=93489 RepID=A0ACC3DYX4_9PEZI|nr:hypothetical protein LTS18_013756 [Coniosporium uncinatum]
MKYAEDEEIHSYDAVFEQSLIDSGVYPYNRGPKPHNWEEMNNRPRQPRASLSPSQFSEGASENFQQKNEDAESEARVMSTVFPLIRGNAAIPSGENRLFNNLAPLSSDLAAAKPDYYNGTRPTEIDPRVRRDLKSFIVPSKREHAPLLANFFMEAKGQDGNAAVLRRQVTMDAAYGARGILEIQSYGQDSRTYDGNAYTIGSSYSDGQLKMYTMHPSEPVQPEDRPSYHMTQIRAFALTDSVDSCRDGMQAFRNGQDLAKKYREAAIARANDAAVVKYGAALAIQASDPSSASFISQSQTSTQDEPSQRSQPEYSVSETSLDETVTKSRSYGKRSSNSRQPRHRKRNVTTTDAGQSRSAVYTQQNEQWSWADGAFQCFQDDTVVKTQNETPADV